MRWKEIERSKIVEGERIRIVQRQRGFNRDVSTVLTFEGMVDKIETTRRDKFTLLPGGLVESEEVVAAVQLYGWLVNLDIGASWETVSIETARPDLPWTAGSVILIGRDHRAAVLRAPIGSADPRADQRYLWADGAPGGPNERELAEADILHVAKA